jgi:oligoribonuclease
MLSENDPICYECTNQDGMGKMTQAKVKRSGDQYLVWFDTEYSGLHLEDAYLLQVAALITDRALKRVMPAERDIRLTVRLPAGAVVSPWVEENLSDLLALCRSPLSSELRDVDRILADYIDGFIGPPADQEKQRPIMAGNTIHADWRLAQKYLPHFTKRLHYRHLDVTTLKIEWQNLHAKEIFEKEDPENIRRYFPEARFIEGETRHDAYYDIQASIAELAFYRQHLFRK